MQVTSVVLELGSREVCCAVLQWNGGGGSVANSADSTILNLSTQNDEVAASNDSAEWNRLSIVSKLRYGVIQGYIGTRKGVVKLSPVNSHATLVPV